MVVTDSMVFVILAVTPDGRDFTVNMVMEDTHGFIWTNYIEWDFIKVIWVKSFDFYRGKINVMNNYTQIYNEIWIHSL